MTQRPNDPHIARVNKRSYDNQQIIEQLTRNVPTWQDKNRNNTTEISVSFNPGGFNEYQKQEARRSLTSWSDVVNLQFTENGGPSEGRATFGISNRVPTAQAAYPTPYGGAGRAALYNPRMVTRAVITHEIGHALGLKHPGNSH